MTNVGEKVKIVTDLLNCTVKALNGIIPCEQELINIRVLHRTLTIYFGVLLGISGDIKGKLVLAGNQNDFHSIGEMMFGMPIGKEMLALFSEFRNMLVDGVSTNIGMKGIDIDNTSPVILQGKTSILGYKMALQVIIGIKNVGEISIYLLLD